MTACCGRRLLHRHNRHELCETLQKLEQQGRSGASVNLVRDYWNVRDELTLAQVEALGTRDRSAAVERLQQALTQHPTAPVIGQKDWLASSIVPAQMRRALVPWRQRTGQPADRPKFSKACRGSSR